METKKEERKPIMVFRLGTTGMSVGVLSLPLVGFILVVIISVVNDFESSTATHCRVRNYLPTISAAISCCTPQRYIWRLCIALHSAPRFIIAIMYYNHYMAFPISKNASLFKLTAAFNTVLHIAENSCLLLLSFVMSTENYGIHEKGFIGFMIFSALYMVLTLVVFKWSRSTLPWSDRDKKSYRWKMIFFVFNLSTFLVSIYYFLRHNKYCEPGMYTMYALLEYFVVLSNIAFHATAIYEFGQGEWVISEVPVEKLHLKST